MKILAFETSCDDTSVAILDNKKLLALSTRTQLEHNLTGGVVPEVAARSHANAIFPCLDDVLDEAKCELSEIDYIACTAQPGLQPSLLTGKTVARMLSDLYEIPLLWIDHIESHIFANFLDRDEEEIIFPSVVLTISGGHTELYLWKSLFEMELLGQTRDDAVGEAYDKVAKMLGMGFPGGAKVAQKADEYRNSDDKKKQFWYDFFPRSYLESDSWDFSFSGLKSAVKRQIDATLPKNEKEISQICFAFESAVFDVLLKKMFSSAEKNNITSLVLAGGVSANQYLKKCLQQKANEKKYHFIAPVKNIYSGDNAAMIGIRAYYEILKNQ